MTTTKKLIWLAVIYFIGFFGYQAYVHWPLVAGSTATPAGTVTAVDWTKPWVMKCQNIRGMEIGRLGYIHQEYEVFMIHYSDKSISFSRYFFTDQGNEKKRGSFSWDKINGEKEGSWSQKYPFDHGTWTMEGNPEKRFTGWITNKEGTKMNFTLRPKG